MQKDTALKVASAIFFVIAVLHLARVIFNVPAMFGGWAIPNSISVIAFIVAAVLSWWMFKTAK